MIHFQNKGLQELLNDFYFLTDLKTCVFNLEYVEMAYSPVKLSDLCRYLRKNTAFDNACRACDVSAMRRCRQKREGFLYRCHLGLTEYVTPLFCGDTIVAFLMIGHIPDGTPEEWEMITQCLEKYNFDVNACRHLYETLPHLTPEQLTAAGRIIEACASHIHQKRMLEVRQLDTMQQIEQYIMDHLDCDPSVERLCELFGVSRGKLYQMFQDAFGSSVADYIRSKRLARAEMLIRTTSERITEIARRVGFYDHNYFSRVFRSVYGLSPREYRKATAGERPRDLPESE